MFAIYWPVMALVASVVLVLAIVVLSSFGLCKGFGIRMDPLPERDLNTYLPEDDDNNAAVFEDIDPALNNTDLDLEMGYPPSATAVY